MASLDSAASALTPLTQPLAAAARRLPEMPRPELSSELLTVLTIAINIAGGGLLVLPMAMHEASVVTGMALLVVCAAASAFTAHVIVLGCVMTDAASLPEAFARVIVGPDTGPMSEEDAARRLAKRRRIAAVVDAMVACYTLGMLVMYVRVVADMCVDAAAAFTAQPQWLERNRYFGASFLLFFGLTCMRQLSELAASTVAGLITVVYIAIAMVIEYAWFSFRDRRLVHPGVEWAHLNGSVALAIPVVTVAIGYHYNAPAMYHEMEDATPRKFRRAVVAATVLCTALFSLVGLIGYFTFGPEVAGPLAGGNIVNNYPRSDRLMAIARIALAAHIVCVFPVIAISVRDALHRLSLRAAGQHEMAEDADVMVKAHRSVVVLEAAVVCGAAVAIAIDVPHISLVVDVVGVLFGIFLVFIAPGLMGLAINGGMWRTSRLAQQRLETVDAFVKPSARRELTSLAIASLGSMAMIIGLLSVLGLIKIPP